MQQKNIENDKTRKIRENTFGKHIYTPHEVPFQTLLYLEMSSLLRNMIHMKSNTPGSFLVIFTLPPLIIQNLSPLSPCCMIQCPGWKNSCLEQTVALHTEQKGTINLVILSNCWILVQDLGLNKLLTVWSYHASLSCGFVGYFMTVCELQSIKW